MPEKGVVFLYSEDWCPYCRKTKDMLAQQIGCGHVIVKSGAEKPMKDRGIPQLYAPSTGKVSLGAPASLPALAKELGLGYRE